MKFTYLICIGAIVTASCVNQAPKEEPKAVEEKQNTTPAPSHEENTLVLNEGERWEANTATTEGVNNMIALISNFSNSESNQSYEVLADTLESEFKMIFKNCTMTGEAHNQLHNFLFPMKEKLKMLGSADSTAAAQAYSELNKHIALYSEFFE